MVDIAAAIVKLQGIRFIRVKSIQITTSDKRYYHRQWVYRVQSYSRLTIETVVDTNSGAISLHEFSASINAIFLIGGLPLVDK